MELSEEIAIVGKCNGLSWRWLEMSDREPRKTKTNVVSVDAATLTAALVLLLLVPLLVSGFWFQ
ncbi:MAG: hypothetical protein AAF215_12075 [Cyanobacteria bacterium P01_A01_bin.123]